MIPRKIITSFLIVPGQTQVKLTDYKLAHVALPSLSQCGSVHRPFAAVALSPLSPPPHPLHVTGNRLSPKILVSELGTRVSVLAVSGTPSVGGAGTHR